MNTLAAIGAFAVIFSLALWIADRGPFSDFFAGIVCGAFLGAVVWYLLWPAWLALGWL
jgi:hypothetical protein